MKYILTCILSLFCFAACNSQGGNKEEIKKLLKEGSAKIIDVRTPEEFGAGHAKGSVNYPLQTFADSIIHLNPDEQIVLVCRSGNRSGRALKMLQEKGYKHIYNAGKWQNVDEWRGEE